MKPKSYGTIKADIAIIGGGTGGVAAALAALRARKRVVMTEETDWIGGQLTAQAVPPDDHGRIELCGCTRSYRRFRDGVRDYYRQWYPLNEETQADPFFNPGGGTVSKLCHEPRIALAVLEAMLQPFITAGALTLLRQHLLVEAATQHDRICAVLLRNTVNDTLIEIEAAYFLDATELGDLLKAATVEYVVGAESQDETGELHAPAGLSQPLNQQSFTTCFAVSHHPGEDYTISRPDQYDFWNNDRTPFWPGSQLSWVYCSPRTRQPMQRVLFDSEIHEAEQLSFWRYRRILRTDIYRPGSFAAEISLVNWPQIDYWRGPLIDVTPGEAARHREASRQLSLSFLYWMQTAASRPDGGTGYPGLKLRLDITGTHDGLAKYPYIRESRRIQAEFTVLEQHIARHDRPQGPELFDDSIGIGAYSIDLHPSTGASGSGEDGDNYIDFSVWPFQIPLGSLIPVRVENVLPACKNLGVTHITNGCYRLHPVEWSIGEAAGALAAHCLDLGESPRSVRNSPQRLADFQYLLQKQGFELEWTPVPEKTSAIGSNGLIKAAL